MGNMWSRAIRVVRELVRCGVPVADAVARVAPLYGLTVADLRRLHAEDEKRRSRRLG